MLALRHYEVLDKLPKPGSKKDPYRRYRSKVPEGTKGKWTVSKFTVDAGIELLRLMRDGRGTPPGEYTRLSFNGHVIMSDTDAEIDDHQELFRKATGHVLIHGLGLGVALQAMLATDEVSHVDVVEIDADVIELVGKHFKDKRLMIHHADCRTKTWPKESSWDVVWHDIWPDICGDNLDEMQALRRRFSRKCDWQGCWAERYVRRLADD